MRVAKIERKIEYFPIVGGEIKATNDAQGIVEGYLNYIGNIDFGDDRTMKGAFKRTLTDSYARKVAQDLDFLFPYLFNHDYTQLPPGGIFEATEDRKGLYTKTQFNLDIQMGRELYSSFKMGTMKKQSMGYKVTQKKHCAILPLSSPAQAWMSFLACPASQAVPLSASGHEVLPDAEPLVSIKK